ncbi:hypothetical protein FGO68_gene9899 [Halteria grandinella]|uniref:Uncharacterized protein n=1 Tax=Halteria grandinella TaxID=5974 RepID=A0A8J8SWU6_HALGN|nr:hypothetical protein FGO68_gene9899 [Halteria grandinella]
MIHTLLNSTIDIENAPSLPPISLTILKFKDGDPSMSLEAKSLNNLQQLNELAKIRGLVILDFQIFYENCHYKIYACQIKLISQKGRALNIGNALCSQNQMLAIILVTRSSTKFLTQLLYFGPYHSPP